MNNKYDDFVQKWFLYSDEKDYEEDGFKIVCENFVPSTNNTIFVDYYFISNGEKINRSGFLPMMTIEEYIISHFHEIRHDIFLEDELMYRSYKLNCGWNVEYSAGLDGMISYDCWKIYSRTESVAVKKYSDGRVVFEFYA